MDMLCVAGAGVLLPVPGGSTAAGCCCACSNASTEVVTAVTTFAAVQAICPTVCTY